MGRNNRHHLVPRRDPASGSSFPFFLLSFLTNPYTACTQPPSRSAPQPSHDSSYFRQLELEDLIKREQLEVFALEQLKAEKEAEVRSSLFLSPSLLRLWPLLFSLT